VRRVGVLDSGLPLVALAGCGTLLGCLLTVAACAVVLVEQGHPASAVISLVAGVCVSVLVGVAATVLSSRHATALRSLRRATLARSGSPAAKPTSVRGVLVGAEVEQLAHTLEALQVRVRVADEVAERHRRSAQNASAGMFELLSGLVAAEEGARGQLSAELHDTVAQSLMLIRARLDAACRAGDPCRCADVRSAAELVVEAEDQVRAVMARTRPPALREGDLARAVSALRDDLEHRYGLRVHLSWPERAYPLPLPTAVTVYRFFQEALLNVVKHADVDQATASLQMGPAGLVAAVQDEGPGFDPAEVRADRGRHVGLGLLRERARLAGGSLEVTSWPHQATTLTLRLPAAQVALNVESSLQVVGS
jgi:signal transduction histidine kinase